MKYITYSLAVIVSVIFIVGSYIQWLPFSQTEAWAFVTGGWTVWLTVKENIWNWPIGIANSAFFAFLFWSSSLYGDMGLQIVYIILGFLGWYWWLYGGDKKDLLPISKATTKTHITTLAIGVITTIAGTYYFRSIGDSAPFLDSLTTVMSLCAQYYLTKKFIENWYIWISADVIYIGLYWFKGLHLTSALYLIFLTMCIVGLRQWKTTHMAYQEK